MGRWVSVALLGAWVACTPTGEQPLEASEEASNRQALFDPVTAFHGSPDDRWVIVRAGSPLYLHSQGSHSLDTSAFVGDSGPTTAGFAMIHHGQADGRLRVLVAPLAPDRCLVDHAGGRAPIAFTAYVDPSALHTVTTSPIERTFFDDTEVEIGAGVPLFATDNPRTYAVISENLGLELGIPESQVGTHFHPTTAKTLSYPNAYPATDNEVLRYAGDGEVQDTRHLAQRRLSAWRYVGGEDFMARTTDQCIRVQGTIDRVRVDRAANDAAAEELSWEDAPAEWWLSQGETHDEIPPRPPPTKVVDPGSPVYLDDGTPIGMVRRLMHLHDEAPAPSKPIKLRCFSSTLGFGSVQVLCFDPHDIREIDRFWADERQPTKRAPFSHVVFEDTEAKIGGETRAVRRGLRTAATDLQRCYQGVLAREGQLAGTLQIYFQLTQGSVEKILSVKDGIGDDRAAKCVTDRLLSVPFPRSGSGYVRQDLRFESVRP